MKSYTKIILILLYAMALTVVLSPIIAGIVPFHLYEVTSRVMMILVFFLFYYFKVKLGFYSIRELGIGLTKKWFSIVFAGYAIGILTIGIVAISMVFNGVRYFISDTISSTVYWYILGYVFIGFIVAVVEEILFRGFILQGLMKDTNAIIALFFTSIFYSAVHFLKPDVMPEVDVLNLYNSIKGVPHYFTPLFTNINSIMPSFIGLFLVGMVLGMAYIRTGSLALPIGMHAGWILGIKAISLITDTTLSGSFWVSGKAVENPMTWIMLTALIMFLYVGKDTTVKTQRRKDL